MLRAQGGNAKFVTRLLINGEGELRSGWRVLTFLLLLIVFSIPLGVLLGRLAGVFPPLIYLGVERGSLLAAALAATWICARSLEGRSLASTGYGLHKGWLRDFGLGFLLGAATLAAAVAIAAAAGAVRFEPENTGAGPLATNFVALFVVFLIAAAYEEVLIRGFPFQALAHNLGPAAAIAITSIAFALLHLNNPNATFFPTVNICLAGVWLGAAYLVTKSLWLATALHLAWNLVTVFVFGLPLSGLTQFDELAWLDGEPLPPAWLSGGSFGPEGGFAATVAFALSTLVICKGRLFSPSEQMQVAIRHRKRGHADTEGPRDFRPQN